MDKTALTKQVAEFMGWHTIQQNPFYPDDESKLAGFLGSDKSALLAVPDYARCLNAINRAERILLEKGVRDNTWRYYDNYCHRLIQRVGPHDAIIARPYVRAEELLRTIQTIP